MIKRTFALIASLVAVAAITMVPSAAAAKPVAKPQAEKCPPGTRDKDYCESPSIIKVASSYAVVSENGRTSIDLACFGASRCKGTMTISHAGTVFASVTYDIAGNDVGAVDAKLSAFGLERLENNPGLGVTVTAVDTAGPSATRKMPLYLLR